MGICYFVANTLKRQYFDPGWFGENTKRSGILAGMGGHTLAQLLLPDNPLDFHLSSWIGDPLVLVGDDDPKPIDLLVPYADHPSDEPYDIIKRHFDDITLNLIAFMSKSRSVVEKAKTDAYLLINLVHAALYLPAPHIEQELLRQMGENWRDRFEEALRANVHFHPLPWTPALEYLPRPRSICRGQFVLDHRPHFPSVS